MKNKELQEEILPSIYIREIRQVLGLTQEQFAVKLGVTFPTVNRWENLKTKPSPLALQKLQKILANLRKKGVLTNASFKPSITLKAK